MEKKIRVLHVAEAAGGVERYLEALFKYTDHDQVENILICSQNYDYEKMKQLTDRVIVIKWHIRLIAKQILNLLKLFVITLDKSNLILYMLILVKLVL